MKPKPRSEVLEEQRTEDGLFELVAQPRSRVRLDGVVIGSLRELGSEGELFVDYPGNPGPAPVAARATVALGASDVDREVALMFEDGDPAHPIVLGLIQHPGRVDAEPRVEVDRERVVFDARKEIVLRCGKASITLTHDGKIRIRGADLLSRSSGGHRIKGGSVHIN